MAAYLPLTLLGVGVGAVGTLVGAGGGFVLTPALLLLYPNDSALTITSISLVVVVFNAASGTLAYARMRRIDYRSGAAFATAALPGSIAGALAVNLVPIRVFDAIMGAALATAALIVARLRPHGERPRPRGRTSAREIVDLAGGLHRYHVPVRRGAAYSAAVGFLSSFLGIGGGVMHVPLMVAGLGFPTHIATATSHFALIFMAGAGSLTHLLIGAFAGGTGLRRSIALAVGVVPDAQIGAILSQRLPGPAIRRILGIALLILAGRVLGSALA